jgi:6-phosphofructokinase 1
MPGKKTNETHEWLSPEQEDLLGRDLSISKVGECVFDSPLSAKTNREGASYFVPDDERVLAWIDRSVVEKSFAKGLTVPGFEKAGPRRKLFFEPGETVSAIVTCGGLCPGLNSVIRGLVLMNYYRYNNQRTYGIQFGFSGLVKESGHEVKLLTPDVVDGIHTMGGTILGSSRGNQDPEKMVDRLVELGVSVLYTIGGDGTQRGAISIREEIEKRGLRISVVGIPKTIDNDISYIDKSFGMETAFSEACTALYAAHTEAKASEHGVGIVKVMGRESGFIAANATMATDCVNYCLIPELDFDMDGKNGLLAAIEKRLQRRNHAVIVVAEGAGQRFVDDPKNPKFDASGNKKLGDIGLFLKASIAEHMKKQGIETTMRYIDPSYMIRSVAPTPNDSIFCAQLAQMAVHAGMSGRTGLVVGYLNGEFTHLPMELATSKRKKIDLDSPLWGSVIEATGQPLNFKN